MELKMDTQTPCNSYRGALYYGQSGTYGHLMTVYTDLWREQKLASDQQEVYYEMDQYV